MELRIARAEDAARIQEIYAPYVKNTNITFEYEVPSVEEMAQRIKTTLKSYPYIVAVEDHRVVGYAYASLYRSRKAYEWDCELSIYIDQDKQVQGIGKRLYQALFNILKIMNVQNVYACITHPNERSEIFHKRFGFRLIGAFTKSGYKFGKWHDMIWMEKSIGDYQKVSDIIPFSLLKSTEIESSLDNSGVQKENYVI